MKKLSMVAVLALLLVTGCAMTRQCAKAISTENVKNAETIREVSQNCLSVWNIQSGFIKGALGYRINELPNEAIEAIKELDRLASLPELTDYELGLFLGLKVRLLSSVVQKTLEKYAPDVIDLMPLVF
jgi:hypothetical protein